MLTFHIFLFAHPTDRIIKHYATFRSLMREEASITFANEVEMVIDSEGEPVVDNIEMAEGMEAMDEEPQKPKRRRSSSAKKGKRRRSK